MSYKRRLIPCCLWLAAAAVLCRPESAHGIVVMGAAQPKRCPYQLLYIHYNVHYYSVIECPNTMTTWVFGYNSVQRTGCNINNECNTPETPLIMYDPSNEEWRGGPLGPIDKDKYVGNAEFIFKPTPLPTGVTNWSYNAPAVVEVEEDGAISYYVVIDVKATAKTPTSPVVQVTCRSAQKLTGLPPGVTPIPGTLVAGKITLQDGRVFSVLP